MQNVVKVMHYEAWMPLKTKNKKNALTFVYQVVSIGLFPAFYVLCQ